MSSSSNEGSKITLPFFTEGALGLVLSGGGSRAAYQVGVLKALLPYLEQSSGVSVIVGSSIGAVNGIVLGGCLVGGINHAVTELESLWRERSFKNTFRGSPSRAFLNAIKVAIVRYSSPGPVATRHSIFDPTPLIERIDSTLERHGGLTLENRDPNLKAVAVMTTLEGTTRKPLLFVNGIRPTRDDIWRGAAFDVAFIQQMNAKHGLASAALPSVLPSVEVDLEGGRVRLVDGGICENIPVDPAVRLGADRVIVLDVSGRTWWHDCYGSSHDERPTWEVPAGAETYCMRPPETLICRTGSALGPLLKDAVSLSRKDFISSLGPTWPIFSILKRRMGEALAYEVMSYVALHPAYIDSLIEAGYRETKALIAHLESGSKKEATSQEALAGS